MVKWEQLKMRFVWLEKMIFSFLLLYSEDILHFIIQNIFFEVCDNKLSAKIEKIKEKRIFFILPIAFVLCGVQYIKHTAFKLRRIFTVLDCLPVE